jgi:hypothetical protein
MAGKGQGHGNAKNSQSQHVSIFIRMEAQSGENAYFKNDRGRFTS